MNVLFGYLLLAAGFVKHVAACETEAGGSIEHIAAAYCTEIIFGCARAVRRAFVLEAPDTCRPIPEGPHKP